MKSSHLVSYSKVSYTFSDVELFESHEYCVMIHSLAPEFECAMLKWEIMADFRTYAHANNPGRVDKCV